MADKARDLGGQRWITVRPHGPTEKGQPVLINGDGTVAGGMGGRFNGKPLAHIYGDTGDTGKEPAPQGDGPHAQYNPHADDNELGPEFDATVHGTPAYKDGAFHVHLKNPHLGRALTAGHRTTEGGARLEFHPSGDGVLYHGPAGVHGPDQYEDFAHALSMDAGGHVYDHLQREHERRMAGNDQWPDFGDFGGVDEGAPDASSDADQQAYQQEALKELSAHRAASLKDVRDFIRGQGGIKANRMQTAGQQRQGKSARQSDEYRYLPAWAKNNERGIPADKMAMHIAEAFPGLGIQTDDDLREYLMEHERERAGVREAGWTKKERDDLPDDDFAGPGQSFPIKSQQDVHDAAHLIGKADNPAAVKARIKAIARRKGFSLPDAWRDDEDDDRPVRETAVQDVRVLEAERTPRGVRLRNVQLISAGPGNSLYGNHYEPEAVQALVPLVQAQPKCYLDHSLPSEVKERGHRSLRDLAGVYDRASVHYDPATQATRADLIVRPSVYDEYVAPVLEAGDNLGISVDGIGHCPDAPRRVKGWKIYNSADLVPAGGARGFIVREADSPAAVAADKEFAMGLLTDLSAGDVQKDAPTLYEAIGRAYAEAHPVVREAQTPPPADDSRLVALETRVREAEERAATSEERVTEMEAERNREVWAQHIAAYVRECGAQTDAVATLIAEPFAGATVGGPDSVYATQEDLEAAVKVKAERVLAAVREAATPAPRPASGQITGMGTGTVTPSPARPSYATPAETDAALLTAIDWMVPAPPAHA